MQSEQGINSGEQGDNPAKSLGNRIYREFVRKSASPTMGGRLSKYPAAHTATTSRDSPTTPPGDLPPAEIVRNSSQSVCPLGKQCRNRRTTL